MLICATVIQRPESATMLPSSISILEPAHLSQHGIAATPSPSRIRGRLCGKLCDCSDDRPQRLQAVSYRLPGRRCAMQGFERTACPLRQTPQLQTVRPAG